MPFFVRIPGRISGDPRVEAERYVNFINGNGTIVQRELRRKGYAGYQPLTEAWLCAVFEKTAERVSDRPFVFLDIRLRLRRRAVSGLLLHPGAQPVYRDTQTAIDPYRRQLSTREQFVDLAPTDSDSLRRLCRTQ